MSRLRLQEAEVRHLDQVWTETTVQQLRRTVLLGGRAEEWTGWVLLVLGVAVVNEARKEVLCARL